MIKKTLIILFLILIPSLVIKAQNANLNSKYSALRNAKSDKEKIDLMNDIAFVISASNTDSLLIYATSALKLSEKNNYKPGIARANRNLSYYYLYKNDRKKAFDYLSKFFEYGQSESDKEVKALANSDYGYFYFTLQEYEKSLKYTDISIRLFKEAKETTSIIFALIQKSSALFYLNKPVESAAASAEALKLAEGRNDTANMSVAYINLSLSYISLRNFKKSLEYSLKALPYLEKINDYYNLWIVYANMAYYYEELKNYDEAVKFRKLAIDVAKKSNDEAEIAEAESGLAYTFCLMKNYSLALEYCGRAMKVAMKSKDRLFVSTVLETAAKIQVAVKNYDLAIKYANQINALNSSPNEKQSRVYSYEILSDAYAGKGDYKKSLEYQKMFKAVYDSVFDKDISSQLIELQTKLETEQKEKENEMLKSQQTLKNEVIKKQYIFIGLSCAALIVLMVLSFFLIRSNNNRKKINLLLNEQKIEIEAYAGKMKELNATKDKFFSIIAHDLKNPFLAIMGISSILIEKYNALSETKRLDFLSKLLNTTKHSYSLLENLLQWSRAQMGNIKMHPEKIMLADFLHRSVNLLKNNAEAKHITITTKVNNECAIFADANMMDTILRNLLGNAIKFTNEHGLIEISAGENELDVTICVKDNGVGIKEEAQKILFTFGAGSTTAGTKNEKGSGLGLVLCKEFVEKQNGKLWLLSKPGEGSSFYFSVPKFI